MLYLGTKVLGIGIFGGLFHSSATTHSFSLFLYIVVSIILLLTSFLPKYKESLTPYNRLEPQDGLFTKDSGKAWPFGPSSDLVSMFLALQSYGCDFLANSFFHSTLISTILCPLSFTLGAEDFSLLLSVIPVTSYHNVDLHKLQILG